MENDYVRTQLIQPKEAYTIKFYRIVSLVVTLVLALAVDDSVLKEFLE